MSENPFEHFEMWFQSAQEANAMTATICSLATADARGRPSCRMVLLKDHGPSGFTVYTHRDSRKGQELEQNPYAALCFHWLDLNTQVRLNGKIHWVDDSVAEAYWATRPRDSQLSGAASKQSALLDDGQFTEDIDALEKAYPDSTVPRPARWTGFCIEPVEFEFWKDGAGRRHHREQYVLDGTTWTKRRLYP